MALPLKFDRVRTVYAAVSIASSPMAVSSVIEWLLEEESGESKGKMAVVQMSTASKSGDPSSEFVESTSN